MSEVIRRSLACDHGQGDDLCEAWFDGQDVPLRLVRMMAAKRGWAYVTVPGGPGTPAHKEDRCVDHNPARAGMSGDAS